MLLESKIQPDTAYQKQQETLIVWSEGENYDLALSFQEKAGCDEIWEKICQVNDLTFFIKGQLISKWNFGGFKYLKKPTKFLADLCPSFIGQKSV